MFIYVIMVTNIEPLLQVGEVGDTVEVWEQLRNTLFPMKQRIGDTRDTVEAGRGGRGSGGGGG
jgi:hypothetical protein